MSALWYLARSSWPYFPHYARELITRDRRGDQLSDSMVVFWECHSIPRNMTRKIYLRREWEEYERPFRMVTIMEALQRSFPDINSCNRQLVSLDLHAWRHTWCRQTRRGRQFLSKRISDVDGVERFVWLGVMRKSKRYTKERGKIKLKAH